MRACAGRASRPSEAQTPTPIPDPLGHFEQLVAGRNPLAQNAGYSSVGRERIRSVSLTDPTPRIASRVPALASPSRVRPPHLRAFVTRTRLQPPAAPRAPSPSQGSQTHLHLTGAVVACRFVRRPAAILAVNDGQTAGPTQCRTAAALIDTSRGWRMRSGRIALVCRHGIVVSAG